MPTRTFDFDNAAGQRLSGRLELPDGPPSAYALFAHCFTCDKASHAATRISRGLAERGVAVLRFDFTGVGDSEGETLAGLGSDIADLVAAADHMRAVGCAPRLLIGHSLGGAAALAAAGAMPEVAAVCVIGAPFDAEHVLRHIGGDLAAIEADGEGPVRIAGRRFKLGRGFLRDIRSHDQEPRIRALGRALLVMHAPTDDVVGVDNAGLIFAAARHPKSFVALDGADHLLARQADADYAAGVIAAWAARFVGGAPAAAKGEPGDGAVMVEETGAGRFQVTVSAAGVRFLADEPVAVGGLGSGPSPYQLLGAGLGACTAMTLRLYAERKGWPLGRVKVAVGHTRHADRAPPDRFEREIALDGDLDEAQRTRLLEIAGRCPVHRTLEGGAEVVSHAAAGPEPDPLQEVEPAAAHFRNMEAACDDG